MGQAAPYKPQAFINCPDRASRVMKAAQSGQDPAGPWVWLNISRQMEERGWEPSTWQEHEPSLSLSPCEPGTGKSDIQFLLPGKQNLKQSLKKKELLKVTFKGLKTPVSESWELKRVRK